MKPDEAHPYLEAVRALRWIALASLGVAALMVLAGNEDEAADVVWLVFLGSLAAFLLFTVRYTIVGFLFTLGWSALKSGWQRLTDRRGAEREKPQSGVKSAAAPGRPVS